MKFILRKNNNISCTNNWIRNYISDLMLIKMIYYLLSYYSVLNKNDLFILSYISFLDITLYKIILFIFNTLSQWNQI